MSNVLCIHREQIDLCVDILERILMALSPEYLAQNYRAELHAGLNHPKEAVKILALTQVGCSHTNTPLHIELLLKLTRYFSFSSSDWQDGGAPQCCH